MTGSDEDFTQSESFLACKDLGNRLAGTFFGFQRKEFRPSILGIVNGGIEFAFTDAPKQLSFLETGVVQFALKLPAGDVKDMLVLFASLFHLRMKSLGFHVLCISLH